MRLGPGGSLKDQPVAQQQLRQPTRPHQIRASVFPRPDQVPGSLLSLGWHPHLGKLPDVQQPGQPFSVSPVGLDPVPGGRSSLDGATTTHPTPAAGSARASPNPVGPAS
jgi:hypothetical protein